MGTQIVILSQTPEHPFVQQAAAYVGHYFPGAIVSVRGYDTDMRSLTGKVALAHIAGNVSELEARARRIGKGGVRVLLLTEGLMNSSSDVGDGIAGVIYRLEGEEFEGFTSRMPPQHAADVLEGFL